MKVLRFSSFNRNRVGLQSTKASPGRLLVKDGVLSVAPDCDDDVDGSSSWSLFRSGFLFMVRAMCEIPSRVDEVGDRLAFWDHLEGLTIIAPAARIVYAEQFMFRYSRSSDWQNDVLADTALLWRFLPNRGVCPLSAAVSPVAQDINEFNDDSDLDSGVSDDEEPPSSREDDGLQITS